jgi:uncharacterized protein
MRRTYLIDGYNLIHALGYLCPERGPHALEHARARLLHFLVEGLGAEANAATVVFDAARAPARCRPIVHFQGIVVRFAVGQDEADDLIETLIHAHPSPRHSLTVVSSDHRLLHAARRDAAVGWTCAEFMDYLDEARRQRPDGPVKPEKAESVSPEEAEHWLREFGDLADDPGFKELFEPYPFDEE